MSNTIRFYLREGAIPLMDGESLEEFRMALVDAVREAAAARGLFGLDEDGNRVGWLWLVEVFDSSAIVEIEPARMEGDAYVPPFCERVPFTRAPDGTFTLGAPTRVRRKIVWEPDDDDAEASMDMEGVTELPDRERDVRAEITVEEIRGVRFPVGDPLGVENAMRLLQWQMEWPRQRPTTQERAQMQAIVDHTNRRAGSRLVSFM